jgi:hypothetical protein
MKSHSPPPSRAELVEREDMVMFINACFACSGQKEFYSDGRGQAVSIEFLHQYILGNYRRLYARCLAAGINHFNKAQVIVNLLASGAQAAAAHRAEEGALIYGALRSLPTQRAYRVLESLRERRVNNRRARAVARRYLAERRDLEHEALKYRNKLRVAATHAHLRLPGELGAFLFRGWKKQTFKTPLFDAFRRAHYSKEAVFELPYSIAEGLAARHQIPRDELLAKIERQLTVGERLRLQGAAERAEVRLELDLGRLGLTRLALYLLSWSVAERQAERARIEAAFAQAARRVLRRAPQRLGKVAAILDRRYSSSGSSEKRRRPLAVAWAAHHLLRAAAAEYRAFWTPGLPARAEAGGGGEPGGAAEEADDLQLLPHGQTDLALPLLAALEWGAELVILVSDGYENDPPRGAAEVARVFRRRLDPQRRTSIIHLNPVFDAEHYAPRTIGEAIPTVGLRDAEDLLTMLGFARFAEGAAPLSELEAYLAEKVKRTLAPASGEGPEGGEGPAGGEGTEGGEGPEGSEGPAGGEGPDRPAGPDRPEPASRTGALAP